MAEKSMNAKGSSRDNKVSRGTNAAQIAAENAAGNGEKDIVQGLERTTY